MENILQQEFESLDDDVGDGDNCIEESNLDDVDNQKYQWFVGPKYSWYPPQKEIDDCIEVLSSNEEFYYTDPYDKFMRRHLQHYGYYTGRNASFRDNFQSLQEWRRNYDVRLSGHHDLSLVEEQLGKAGSPLHNRLLEGPFFSGEGQLPDDLLHRTTQLVFQYQAGRKIPKLREPRNLYALTKEAGPQQATRWPSHMQVVCPAIRFLDVTPSQPEPLFKPTGKEPTPSVRGPQIGEMIYYNDPGRDVYFMRSRVAGCRLAMRSMTLTPRDYPEDNTTLEFESRFESGNLLKVDKITDFEYELTLRTDLYTNKHTQWYFFRVRNMRPGKTYRFTVVNLMKPSSLYNQGMRPLFYSDSNAKKNKIGWTRFGTNIRYYRNNLCSRDGRCYYSLTWQCDFPYKDDTCYFAHCYPYTYTDLQEYLLMLANDPVRSRFCKQRVLCRTLAGNLVYILTITSPSRNPEISRAKKAVVLSARVHPGETNASWMMKGFLDYLTGKSADAKLLRDTFIFKIVPMLNPDGVIVGNYRCSLAGRDLNRNYKSVLKDSFPSIWHTKMMVKRLRAEREVVLYCDLHGHSRKNNIFIYGCENKHNPQKRLRERVFPLMLSKNAHQSFSFDSCKYKVQKSKEGTGRIVMWYLGVMNSYTLEATFGGTSLPGTRKDTHLNTHDLEQIGYHFCDTLLDYCDPDLSKVNACMHELQERMRRQIMKKLRLQGSEDINIDDYMSDMESDTSGSDSSCDDGLPVHLLAIAPKLQRKKKMRSRRERNKVIPSKAVVPPATESMKSTSHSAKLANDKIKAIRYSQGSNKKRDDRSTSSRPTANSASGYTEDRGTSNDKSTKKLATVSLKYVNPLLGIFITRSGFVGRRVELNRAARIFHFKTDYLEVLTSAYIRSGVLMVPDAKKDYPLRYSNGSKPPADGNFSVKYLANQLGMMSESDDSKPNSPEMRNASCQWSPQPNSNNETDSDDQKEVEKEAMLAEEQYEILRQSALKRQLSAGQQRLLAQKHLVAVAEMQQRKENVTKTRTASATGNRVSSGSPIKQHPNPFEEKKDDLGQEYSIMTSQTDKMRPISRTASASNPIAHKPRSARREGSSSASIGHKEETFSARDLRPFADDSDTEFLTTHRSSRPISSNSETTSKKLSNFALPSQTSITVDTSHPLMEGFDETKKQTILSYKSRSHYLTSKDSLPEDAQGSKPDTILDLPNREQVEDKLTKSDLSLGGGNQSKPRILTWISNDKAEHNPGNKLTAMKPFHSNKLHYEENSSIKEEIVRKRQSLLNNPSSFAKQHAAEIANDFGEGRSPRKTTEQSSSDLTIALPKRGTSLNQSDMKALVQGELALPRTTDTTIIPTGIKKSNAVVMETDPDKLTIKSNRYYVKPKPADSVAEVHSNHYRAKSYQTTDDSFFGMSDRIGLAIVPKSGTRVPPVVANIAELRRSLMGHGRESNESTSNPAGKKGAEDPPNSHDDGIPFSQRPRRRNLAARQRSRGLMDHDDQSPRHQASHNKPVIKPNVHETLMQDTQRRLATVFDDDEALTDSDNMDNMSTVATFSDKRQSYKRHREGIRKASLKLGEKNAQESRVDDIISGNVTKPDSAGRVYTQGNTTIEKSPDTSMTNIRIGSKTNERDAQSLNHWTDSQPKTANTDISNTANSHPIVHTTSNTPTISSVSLNISGDNDDRTCVTTPALASRPVPPLLRYLSAKQVQSKKK